MSYFEQENFYEKVPYEKVPSLNRYKINVLVFDTPTAPVFADGLVQANEEASLSAQIEGERLLNTNTITS